MRRSDKKIKRFVHEAKTKKNESEMSPNKRGALSSLNLKRNVAIVVLGDIARSPRMTYHALSLAEEGFLVHFIGQSCSSKTALENHPSITINAMKDVPLFLKGLPRIFAYPIKIYWFLVTLLWSFLWMILFHQFWPNYILMQNPPAVPTIAVCWFYSKLFSCKFLIDWHNYAHSLMALTLGKNHIIVKLAHWIEDYFGAKADKSICVTQAMNADLTERLGIRCVTLYDRPAEKFKPLDRAEKINFIRNLSEQYPCLREMLMSEEERPRLIVSGTSWTEDENFDILLTSLRAYDCAKEECIQSKSPRQYRNLLVFITGKGPLKEFYRKKIEGMNFSHVQFEMPWLKHEEYPKLLACADLGISLHYSSSGLDLPMKVVDMFGCGLPVFALKFKCINELVKEGENGLLFSNEIELTQKLLEWFRVESSGQKDLKFRNNLKVFEKIRWHQNWISNVLPLFIE